MTDIRKDLDALLQMVECYESLATMAEKIEFGRALDSRAGSFMLEHRPTLRKMLDGEPVAEIIEVGGSIAAVRWNGESLPVGTKLYAAPPVSREPCKTHVPGFEIDMHGTIGCLRCGMPLPAPPEGK